VPASSEVTAFANDGHRARMAGRGPFAAESTALSWTAQTPGLSVPGSAAFHAWPRASRRTTWQASSCPLSSDPCPCSCVSPRMGLSLRILSWGHDRGGERVWMSSWRRSAGSVTSVRSWPDDGSTFEGALSDRLSVRDGLCAVGQHPLRHSSRSTRRGACVTRAWGMDCPDPPARKRPAWR
jgi:hypothetical protein